MESLETQSSPKFRNKRGELTSYALHCGYVDVKVNKRTRVRTEIVWQSCAFRVRVWLLPPIAHTDEREQIREEWRPTIEAARRYAAKYRAIKYQAPAKS